MRCRARSNGMKFLPARRTLDTRGERHLSAKENPT
jgi:hypothetical protein